MINFSLSREIYGVMPWLMDVQSIPVMTSILKNIKNGVKFEPVEEKLNSLGIYSINQETRVISRPYGNSYYPGQLENNDDFEGVGVINLNGPITRSGGMSSLGMDYLSSLMLKMAQDSRIKGFIISCDSGGGSSSAVEIMNNTINKIKKEKPIYTHIPMGATAGSAAYGIISGSNKIYTESEMNLVGSLGTMIQFEGKKANSQSPDGTKNIRLYATKSVAKNKEFEEALNNDNYQLLITEMLDPVNEKFLSMIENNRPAVKNIDYSNGAHHFAKNVIGSLVDGYATFDEVVSEIILNSSTGGKTTNKFNNNSKTTKKMTKAEFKNAHPDIYSEIVSEGIALEKDRVGAWMAHSETDIKSVKEGIESGKEISQAQREQFFVKQGSKRTLESLQTGSTPDVQTPESQTNIETINNDKKAEEIEQAFGFELK